MLAEAQARLDRIQRVLETHHQGGAIRQRTSNSGLLSQAVGDGDYAAAVQRVQTLRDRAKRGEERGRRVESIKDTMEGVLNTIQDTWKGGKLRFGKAKKKVIALVTGRGDQEEAPGSASANENGNDRTKKARVNHEASW